MLAAPFDGYFADRYIMDFYDVGERDICSRMHYHTGLRFVRMMTGVDTRIRVSSLSPFTVTSVAGVTELDLRHFTDMLPDVPEGYQRIRYNAVVPPDSWVDLQIPRGTSHQFNAIGSNAIIDSVPSRGVDRDLPRVDVAPADDVADHLLADQLPSASTCDKLPS